MSKMKNIISVAVGLGAASLASLAVAQGAASAL